MTAPRLLCVGALTYDIIFRVETLPEGSGKFLSSEMVQMAAGMASSAGSAASRQGGHVSLWASVGDDALGNELVQQMEQEGIDCARVRRVAGGRSAVAASEGSFRSACNCSECDRKVGWHQLRLCGGDG
jgi:sulfofructose kinase